MVIKVNGNNINIDKKMSLKQFLHEQGMVSNRVIVELNRDIVKKEKWDQKYIHDGDSIEVVMFVGGR